MTGGNEKIDLLIREIDPSTKNGRYLRENLRRIKVFIDSLSVTTTAIANTETTVVVNASNSQIAAATVYETQVCTSNGQTVFSLSETPQESGKVRMSVNGEEIGNGVYFAVVGTTVTFDEVTAGFSLEIVNEFGIPDQIIFQYTKA